MTTPDPPGDLLHIQPATAWWSLHCGEIPVLATAIHNGHTINQSLSSMLAISRQQRLREEDPFTEFLIRDVPNRIICHRSRFEVDLNRSREEAFYRRPEQAWGLEVWSADVPPEIEAASLELHDDYYATLYSVLQRLSKRYGKFVVLDVHSYNHRRNGPDARPTIPDEAPEINIGTFSMDRPRWVDVLGALTAHFITFDFEGRSLDVRENVAFKGKGEQTRFIHQHFPETGCAIAIEFKKIFMNEWTG